MNGYLNFTSSKIRSFDEERPSEPPMKCFSLAERQTRDSGQTYIYFRALHFSSKKWWNLFGPGPEYHPHVSQYLGYLLYRNTSIFATLTTTLQTFTIKFRYNARCHWLKERTLSEYKAYSLAKAVTPSAKLYYVWPFPGLLFSFFR